MGTMEKTLLHDHSVGMGTVPRIAIVFTRSGAWSKSIAAACLSCRSGHDVADGGHMIVPSIGQAISVMA